MKRTDIFIIACVFTIFSTIANAHDSKVGSPVDGGIFIYHEPVEKHFNDWIVYPLMDKRNLPSTYEIRLTIIGEGKTTSFIGNVDINCGSSQAYWLSGNNYYEILASQTYIQSVVPVQVIKNSIQLFCKQSN
jgi:hypothetical protein